MMEMTSEEFYSLYDDADHKELHIYNPLTAKEPDQDGSSEDSELEVSSQGGDNSEEEVEELTSDQPAKSEDGKDEAKSD